MRAVDVRVGHDDDLAVTEFGGVEIVFADAGAEGGDHAPDFLVAQHFVVAGFFDVEDFSAQGEDCLILAIAAALGSLPPADFTLDQEQLAPLRIALLAIRELAGQAAGVERAFAPGQIASLAGSLHAHGKRRLPSRRSCASRTGSYRRTRPVFR